MQMKRIGIFGGSFDPIHYGHLHLAEEARCRAKLDQVLFIPAWVSPFKQDTQPADGSQRLEMVRMAIASNPGFSVSDMELKRREVSYTADTLRRCKAMAGGESRLYFITGTDAFLTIEQWYKSEELLRNYSFLIGTRPGYCEEELSRIIGKVSQRFGADVQRIEIPQLDISSSRIREKIGMGESVRYLLPDGLIYYMEHNGLYRGAPEEPSETDRHIEELIAGRLKPKRLSHTYGVVEEAGRLCARFGADDRKAKTCALIHDAFRERGNLVHGAAAAAYMKETLGIDDLDMLNAVRFHTTGRPGMSLLEKVIYLADAIEPGRSYSGVEELRELAESDLDRACLQAMRHTIAYLKGKGESADPLTEQAAADLSKHIGGTAAVGERRSHE